MRANDSSKRESELANVSARACACAGEHVLARTHSACMHVPGLHCTLQFSPIFNRMPCWHGSESPPVTPYPSHGTVQNLAGLARTIHARDASEVSFWSFVLQTDSVRELVHDCVRAVQRVCTHAHARVHVSVRASAYLHANSVVPSPATYPPSHSTVHDEPNSNVPSLAHPFPTTPAENFGSVQ